MEKILREILEKINVIMSYTYVSEKDTLMDIYNELKNKQTEQIDVIEITAPKAIESMKELAFKQGFKIEGNYILVERGETTYRIKKDLWIN